MALSAFPMSYNHLYFVPNFSSPQKKTLSPFSSNSHSLFSHPQLLVITDLISISMDFPILDISVTTWNHTAHDLLCLASLT